MSTDTDRSTIGLQAGVSVQAALGRLSETMDGVNQTVQKLHRFLTPNPITSPIVRPVRGAVVSDGSTYDYINLGGPVAGRTWDLRRLSVARTTLAAGGFADLLTQPASVIAGVAIMHMVPTNQGTANVTAYDDLVVSAIAANTPVTWTWSAHEVSIRGGQVLVVFIKGTTTNDQYLATGQAEEWLESSREQVVA